MTEAQLKSLNIKTAKEGIKTAEEKAKNWLKVLEEYKSKGVAQSEIKLVNDLLAIELNNIKDLIEIIKINGGKYIPKLNINKLTQAVSSEGMTTIQEGKVPEIATNFFNKYKIPIFVLSGLLLFRMIKK